MQKQPEQTDAPLEYKIALVGETYVGKTCIAQRFANEQFATETKSSTTAAFFRRTLKVASLNKNVRFQIWDTAGQECYRALAPMYYRSAAAVLVIFDVTRLKTFQDVKYWVGEVQQKGSLGSLVVLVANKVDLQGEGVRQVSEDVARAYARQVGAKYYETSALTGEGVETMFADLASQKLNYLGKDLGIRQMIEDGKEEKRGCCQ